MLSRQEFLLCTRFEHDEDPTDNGKSVGVSKDKLMDWKISSIT